MKPYYQDNHITIYNKDCRAMSELPDESVQCVVTSPPFCGLRKYSGEQDLIWGGDKDCEHQWGNTIIRRDRGTATNSDVVRQPREMIGTTTPQGSFCQLCGALKAAYGLEPTPEMYIEHTIQILREIRRVLRKDGVVFWDIGDSYWGGGQGGDTWGGAKEIIGTEQYGHTAKGKHPILKPKDLCLIPFRVAIAAQEDGWWVRSVIIWSKPNPMPESVNGWRWERHRVKVKTASSRKRDGMAPAPSGDIASKNQAKWKDCPGCPKCLPNDGYVLCKGSWRPTESHEYILMLAKSDEYYCDAEAVREPYSPTERWGGDTYKGAVKKGSHGEDGGLDRERSCFPDTGRNIRTVWEFPTQPYPEAHFAVFPERLPEICIKAATPEVGCCSKCGAPWARILEKKPSEFNIRVRDAKAGRATPEEGYKATQKEINEYPGNHPDPGYRKTIGWRPACKCDAPRVPSLVLDPFMGVGTTLLVAKKLNRYAVGYELSQEYCQLTVERCRQQVLV